MKRLINYSWPGNVRELENVIERAIINSHNGILNFDFLPKSVEHSNKFVTLEEAEKNHITEALRKSEWKKNGSGGAAEKLKLNPQTLRSKMQKLGIKRDKPH
jgi:transcriptional regulator with GAF, ATPase, and Fis domain